MTLIHVLEWLGCLAVCVGWSYTACLAAAWVLDQLNEF